MSLIEEESSIHHQDHFPSFYSKDWESILFEESAIRCLISRISSINLQLLNVIFVRAGLIVVFLA